MNMIDKDAVLNMIDINIEPHTHGAWDNSELLGGGGGGD